jgi:hypothetical protein
MKKAIFILILSLPIRLYAQEVGDRNWVLKLNALQLFDFISFPTMQVGAERKINHLVSVGADFGLQVYVPDRPDTAFLKAKGFKANVEGRVYLPMLQKRRTPSKKRGELYAGLQFFYNQNQATKSLSYYPINDSTKNYVDNFGAKTVAKGVNLTFGFQISRGRFVFEPYGGLGYANRKIKNSYIEYEKTKYNIRSTGLLTNLFSLEEDSGGAYNICIGFRIGYRF